MRLAAVMLLFVSCAARQQTDPWADEHRAPPLADAATPGGGTLGTPRRATQGESGLLRRLRERLGPEGARMFGEPPPGRASATPALPVGPRLPPTFAAPRAAPWPAQEAVSWPDFTGCEDAVTCETFTTALADAASEARQVAVRPADVRELAELGHLPPKFAQTVTGYFELTPEGPRLALRVVDARGAVVGEAVTQAGDLVALLDLAQAHLLELWAPH